MAHGMILSNKFYWNIDANVGPGCPNKIEDVQLVQLGYLAMGQNPMLALPPEEKAAYLAVVPGATYNGAFSDPLSNAIRVHQKKRGGVQDGVVSSIKNNSGLYSAKLTWIMVALDNNIADVLGGGWPHVDRHPKCPTALRDVAIRVLTPIAA